MIWFSPEFRAYRSKVWLVLASVGLLSFLGFYCLVLQPIRGLRAYVVLSGSMSPTIQPGSVAFTRRVSVSDYTTGSIVAFPEPSHAGVTILHRITGLPQGFGGVTEVHTQGDANTNGDPWVLSLGALQGRMIVVIPWLGYLLHILSVPAGFVTITVLTLLLGVVREVRFLLGIFNKP